MSLGFEKEGFENIFSTDFDKTICQTYRKNFPHHKLVEKDIVNLTKKELLDLTKGKQIDVIIGGTPCQGFSIAGNIGRKFIDDPRNHLFKEFARVVSILKPKFFVIENVARLFNHNQGTTREEIILLFKKLGYSVDCKILNSADYAVPQVRRRVFFIGNRIGVTNEFPEQSVENYRTIAEVIGDLPRLRSGEASTIPNHEAMAHSDQMLQKMKYVSGGGNRDQIPKSLRPTSGDPRKYIKYRSIIVF